MFYQVIKKGDFIMKNRESIKFERTDKGFIGSLRTSQTFIIAKGNTRKEVRKEIKRAQAEF